MVDRNLYTVIFRFRNYATLAHWLKSDDRSAGNSGAAVDCLCCPHALAAVVPTVALLEKVQPLCEDQSSHNVCKHGVSPHRALLHVDKVVSFAWGGGGSRAQVVTGSHPFDAMFLPPRDLSGAFSSNPGPPAAYKYVHAVHNRARCAPLSMFEPCGTGALSVAHLCCGDGCVVAAARRRFVLTWIALYVALVCTRGLVEVCAHELLEWLTAS